MANKVAGSDKSFEIKADTFVQLGALVENNNGFLSPFTADRPVEPNVRKQVAKHGRALSVLASANRATRVQLFVASGMFEYVVYFPEDDSSPVSLRGSNGQVTVTDPASTEDVMGFLAAMIGYTDIATTEFQAESSPAEALVHAAFIDAKRRSLLRALADGNGKNTENNSASITSELGRKGEAFTTLASIVRSVSGMFEVLAEDEISRTIDSLSRRKYLSGNAKNASLTEHGEILAASLLDIRTVLTLNAVRASAKDSRENASFTCAIGGMHDVLMVENVHGKVRMEAVTSRGLLTITEMLLKDPAVIPMRGSESAGFCGNCGRPRVQSDKFCGSCGTAYANA